MLFGGKSFSAYKTGSCTYKLKRRSLQIPIDQENNSIVDANEHLKNVSSIQKIDRLMNKVLLCVGECFSATAVVLTS